MVKSFPPLACIVLAAGQGTRMRSNLPKVLHEIAGRLMILHVTKACEALNPAQITVVLSPSMETTAEAVAPHKVAIQKEPRGTGDAAKAARESLQGFSGDIIVLFGDAPLITPETLRLLQEERIKTGAAIIVAGFRPPDPLQYGRLVCDASGALLEIVEMSEATPQQRAITLCNGGIMLFDSSKLWSLLDELRDDNAKHELFLTDCVKLARTKGWACAVAEMKDDAVEDVRGINTRAELAEVETIMQNRLRRAAMLAGVTMRDPSTVYLSMDTVLGRDVMIEPNVFFGPGVEVADHVQIRAFCHLEKVKIASGAIIGPFARLRPGAIIGNDAHIGNFVEIKNAEVKSGAKINHLTYIGDATIGEKANIGAGTITCNYDGFTKARTTIGANAFIGSNTALVAPVSIGDGAIIGAGSVISSDVPENALSVERNKQATYPDWARRFREKKKKK